MCGKGDWSRPAVPDIADDSHDDPPIPQGANAFAERPLRFPEASRQRLVDQSHAVAAAVRVGKASSVG